MFSFSPFYSIRSRIHYYLIDVIFFTTSTNVIFGLPFLFIYFYFIKLKLLLTSALIALL